MKLGKYIKITKLKPSANPIAPTPAKNKYVSGRNNGFVSLPIDYCVEGYLLNDVEVGNHIVIDRRKRNSDEVGGFMRTTRVIRIKGNRIETRNSIYEIQEKKP